MLEANAVLVKWLKDPLTLLVVARAQARLGNPTLAKMAMDQAVAGWSGDPLAGISLAAI
ncbi:MAG: hypothetical protein Q8L23_10030 [Caulobacter sp.]|nr:hypothetical protein [Caulobacter sp.]